MVDGDGGDCVQRPQCGDTGDGSGAIPGSNPRSVGSSPQDHGGAGRGEEQAVRGESQGRGTGHLHLSICMVGTGQLAVICHLGV